MVDLPLNLEFFVFAYFVSTFDFFFYAVFDLKGLSNECLSIYSVKFLKWMLNYLFHTVA